MSVESNAGSRSEALLTRWGQFIIRHRWLAIVLPILSTGYLVSYIPQLKIDNSSEAFLHADAPANIKYREFRDQFDRDDRVIIALAPENVFDVKFIQKLGRLHKALENEVPYVEEVTSLFNARSTRGVGDELIVEDLLDGWLEEWPDDAAQQLVGLRERVLSNPLYVNNLVSEDATLTSITIKPFTYSTLNEVDELAGFESTDAEADEPLLMLTGDENDELIAEIKGVIESYNSPDFPIHIGGALAITDHINRSLERDMGPFMVLSLLIMLALLFLLFRRLSGSLLPVLVVALSVLSAIGFMVMIEIPGSTAVQILPVFLLSVGICDAVHILTIVYQRLRAGDSQEDAIVYAVGHSGLAVVMTSITTAAGMMSFQSAEMAPIAHLGTIAPIGVMLALAYTLVLLPALLSVITLRPPKRDANGSVANTLTRTLVRIGDMSADYPGRVLFGTACVVAFFLYGASLARFSHNATDWFPEDDPTRISSLLLDEKLKGSMSLEVVLTTDRENGLHEPENLRRIEAAARRAETIGNEELYIGKATSIVDIVKETHKALNENQQSFYIVPDDRQLIAQELLLFENSGVDDLEEIVDTQFQTARLSLRAPFVDALLYEDFMEEVRLAVVEEVGPDIDVEMTGFMPVLASVMSAVIRSMARSYAIALLIITPLMMLLLRDIRLGLMSMIPNLIPVIVTIGTMGWLGMPIDATTMMIGAMVIGLAVDDTIHFMHKFRIYYAQSGDSKQAIRETLESTGTALLFTSLVLTGGFSVFLLATMVNTQNFGFLAALGAAVAFLADLIVAPALMTLATRGSQAKQEASARLDNAAAGGN
ncbi:MAG: hydrophobe/amphiphile efflux-3 (HAE3) family protein [Myxococcota bacterium]|jgi:hydrophobe/amphiphile efflux-3 (HAE3) family protein